MSNLSTETVLRALKISSFEYCSELWWRQVDDEDLRLFVNCNDVFHWGSADVEEITDDNISSLEEAVAECQALVGQWDAADGFILWVARMRELRPQGAFYQAIDKRLWSLFDEAGPEREVGFGNPVDHAAEEPV